MESARLPRDAQQHRCHAALRRWCWLERSDIEGIPSSFEFDQSTA
jgi:hypothetical protein